MFNLIKTAYYSRILENDVNIENLIRNINTYVFKIRDMNI